MRNVPAALYKALGGFATNAVNMTKLESYMVGGNFTATQFYADVEAHPDDRPLKLALEELEFFSTEVKILGVYPAAPPRIAARQDDLRRAVMPVDRSRRTAPHRAARLCRRGQQRGGGGDHRRPPGRGQSEGP